MTDGSASPRSIALAVTGASGAIYATRTIAALMERGCHLELVISDYGRRLLRDELGETAAVDKLLDYLASAYGPGVHNGTYTIHINKDLGAKIASIARLSGRSPQRAPVPVCMSTPMQAIQNGV